MPCQVISSYHIISYHIISYHIISYHIMAYLSINLSHRITSHHIKSHHIASRRIASHRITSHHSIAHLVRSHRVCPVAHNVASSHCAAWSARFAKPESGNYGVRPEPILVVTKEGPSDFSTRGRLLREFLLCEMAVRSVFELRILKVRISESKFLAGPSDISIHRHI